MHRIARHYYRLAVEYLEFFPCVVLIGPRQCGKTTLLKEIGREWPFFDLELSADFDYIKNDPDLFFRLHNKEIIIDEAQLIPELFSALRVAIDSERHLKGRYLLSGSSSPDLLKSISETLAGRVGIIEMAPLSLAEVSVRKTNLLTQLLKEEAAIAEVPSILNNPLDLDFIHKYWFYGGYPEPWVESSQRFYDLWFSQYVRTYIDRDISRLFPGLNKEKFRIFIETLSGFSGQVLNYADIGRLIGVSQTTIREYFKIAHGTFVWRQIHSYEKNIRKRVVKHPKGYLRDSGLLHFLLRIKDVKQLLTHPVMGFSWESLVIEEIIRNLESSGIPFDYYYYRTSNGAEIDLILEGKFGLIPIEIKYRSTVKESQLRTIREFIAEHNCPFGLVINNDIRSRLYGDRLLGLPMGCLNL